MKLLSIIYLLAIFIVIFLYKFSSINLIWVLGYLIILLLSGLIPKKLNIQLIISIIILTGLILLYKNDQISTVLSAFLMLISGLPGIILYTVVYLTNQYIIKSTIISSALAGLSILTLVFLIILHALKTFFDKLVKYTWFLLGIDLIPIIVDLVITIIMTYLVFSHISTLYPIVQNWINNLINPK